jgi:hypothetical protein
MLYPKILAGGLMCLLYLDNAFLNIRRRTAAQFIPSSFCLLFIPLPTRAGVRFPGEKISSQLFQ